MQNLLNALLKSITHPDGTLRTPRPQSAIALTFTAVSAIIFLRGEGLPPGLGEVTLIIIGFYFGDRRNNETTEEPMAPPHIVTP